MDSMLNKVHCRSDGRIEIDTALAALTDRADASDSTVLKTKEMHDVTLDEQSVMETRLSGEIDRTLRLGVEDEEEELSEMIAASSITRDIKSRPVEDTSRKLSVVQQGVPRMQDHSPHDAQSLFQRGDSLLSQFEKLHAVDDVNDAIACLGDAVALLPNDHPDEAHYLNVLASAFVLRFRRLGNIVDLNEGISKQEEAIRKTPGDHPTYTEYLTHLGNAFKMRFDRLGEVANINAAVLNLSGAVEKSPEDDPARRSRLDNLGASLGTRFNWVGDVADLDTAISYQREAVRITEDHDPMKAKYLNNLGLQHDRRFHQLGDASDLDAAISCQQDALSRTSDDGPAKPGYLNYLGILLKRRFERLGNVSDIDAAISSQEEAVRSTPDDHRAKPVYLSALGDSLKARTLKLVDDAGLRKSVLAHREAAHSLTGSPYVRFLATWSWRKSAHLLNDMVSVLESYKSAFDLLPQLVWMGGNMETQYRDVLVASRLACDAAATALTLNNPQEALELLEQGRSIVWGQLLQLRTPLDTLRETRPELAHRFTQLSARFEDESDHAPPTDALDVANEGPQQNWQWELATEWEYLVQEIRELPGFEHFLQPKQFSELVGAARAGPVIVLNISRMRCDALILVSPSEPLRHVRLEEFSYDRALEMQDLLRGLLSSGGLRNRGDVQYGGSVIAGMSNPDDVFREILAGLWTSVVKPVLDCLSLQQSQDRPRIWWCPTGPLAFLPIHAAGLYTDGGKEPPCSLADFAISSYTPTLSTLLTALQKPEQRDAKVLVVIQPAAPGASRLPGTEKELRRIRKRVPADSMLTLERTDTTINAVLSNMGEYAWVHFACHGVQDIANPTKSGLLLQDGRLELSEIIRKPLPRADLAFLSACQTATGDEDRPDEAIHLAAGMLLAGYRGVVGSMWSIQDVDAPFVTDHVYARLMEGGQPSSAKAAKALHEAIRALRRRYNDRSFTSWVPYIHVGV